MNDLQNIDIKMRSYLYNKEGREIVINKLNSFLYKEYVKRRRYVPYHDIKDHYSGEYSLDDLLNDIRNYINESFYHGFKRYPFKWNIKKHVNIDKKINAIFTKHHIPFKIYNTLVNPELDDRIYPTYRLLYTGEFQLINSYSSNSIFDAYILDYVYMVFNEAAQCHYPIIDNKMAKVLDDIYINIQSSYVLSKYIKNEDLRSLSFWNETFFKVFNMPFIIEQKIDMGHKYYLVLRTDNV